MRIADEVGVRGGFVDNELLYKYVDEDNPFLSGMPGFEIHTGGRSITPEWLIDDVEVRLIGGI